MFDNWFISIHLARDLLTNHNLTCVGPIRANKREIAPEFVAKKRRGKYSSLFDRHDVLCTKTRESRFCCIHHAL